MEYNRIADIKRLNFIIDILNKQLPKGAVVLDVGCGNGVISRSLGAKGFNVYGIDVSEKTIEKARQLNTLPNVKFDVISAEQLVAEGKKYNAVICSEVLEHLNQPGGLLQVLHQSIADDGVLIVTVPNGNGPRELLVTRPVISMQKKNNFLWKMVQKIKKILGYSGSTAQSDASDLTHVQFFTKKSLTALANENQFKIIQYGKTNFIEDVFPFSFFTKKFPVLQKMDCAIAEYLPYGCTGGFVTVWQKKK
ncbi:MAG TPA: methyltransferase domain-containing protein [Ferruginibacter sp.]|nr:methyltransferase domain-containing protein [Ferruginibacter sp.]HRE64172.1 methyltransferase domain-containing protein [Ferruginibacter sp.]